MQQRQQQRPLQTREFREFTRFAHPDSAQSQTTVRLIQVVKCSVHGVADSRIKPKRRAQHCGACRERLHFNRTCISAKKFGGYFEVHAQKFCVVTPSSNGGQLRGELLPTLKALGNRSLDKQRINSCRSQHRALAVFGRALGLCGQSRVLCRDAHQSDRRMRIALQGCYCNS